MEKSLGEYIQGVNSILIVLPVILDKDTVAAGLSLYLSLAGELKTKQITVNIYCPTEMTVQFNQLVGVDKVTPNLGSKNLRIKFVDYKGDDIERVRADMVNGEFVLVVLPKPGLSTPKRNQIDISYTGVDAELLILVGGVGSKDFPILQSTELTKSETVHIGIKNFESGQEESMKSLVELASTISEYVSKLITGSGFFLDEDIASNLISGIEEGSDSLKGERVTSQTFSLISKLMDAGGKRLMSNTVIIERTEIKKKEQVIKPVEVGAKRDRVKSGDIDNKEWLEPKILKGTATIR